MKTLAAPAPAPALDTHGQLGSGLGRDGIALAVAAAGSVCLLITAMEAPLPALGWAAAFLFLAVESDVREGRIPNWLTGSALCLFVAHAAWTAGLAGVGQSLLGAAVAFGVLVLPYAAGCFGGGDVKAMMAIGALWGYGVLMGVLGWSIFCGGLLALALLAVRGGLVDLLRRWMKSLYVSLGTRSWTYFGPSPGSAAAGGIPFGVAILLGVAAYQLWGAPWA
jgi:prepilin peptidase CpaA